MDYPPNQQPNTNANPTSDYYGTGESPMVPGYDLTRYQYFIASPFFAGFSDFKDIKRKTFMEEFLRMPPNIKAFLTSVETAKEIFAIGQENNLEEYQIYQTAELFRELVSGKIFVKDASTSLAQKVNIDESKSSDIVNKITSKLFGPIIEDFKRIQRSKFPEKIMQLQKESQPQGLNSRPTMPPAPSQPPKPSIPPPIQTAPTNQPPPLRPSVSQSPVMAPRPTPPPTIQQSRPPATPVQPPFSKPPQSQQSVPSFQKPPATEPKPAQPQMPRLEPQTATPFSTPKTQPQEQKPSNTPAVPKPQFKIPDLGQSFSSTQTKPADKTPVQDISKINNFNNDTKNNETRKSIEDELQKVASIIDLRNKDKEKNN